MSFGIFSLSCCLKVIPQKLEHHLQQPPSSLSAPNSVFIKHLAMELLYEPPFQKACLIGCNCYRHILNIAIKDSRHFRDYVVGHVTPWPSCSQLSRVVHGTKYLVYGASLAGTVFSTRSLGAVAGFSRYFSGWTFWNYYYHIWQMHSILSYFSEEHELPAQVWGWVVLNLLHTCITASRSTWSCNLARK